MARQEAYETTVRMRRLEEAMPTPSPEKLQEEHAKCRALLASRDALDLAPILGIEA